MPSASVFGSLTRGRGTPRQGPPVDGNHWDRPPGGRRSSRSTATRRTNGRTYVCELSDTVDQPQTFTFTLRIVAQDDRPGSVRILRPEAALKDPVAGDDSAPVRLTVTHPATIDSGTSPEVWAAVAGGSAALLAADLLLRRRRRRTA